MRNYDPIKHKEYRERPEVKERLRRNAKATYQRHRDKYLADALEYRREARASILEYLGGKCVQCGFDDPRALCIDHINAGGHKDRKIYSTGTTFYAHIRAVKKKGYQLLCANCNAIKRIVNEEHRWRDKENDIPAP